jgi:hypothetical protein
MQTRILPSFAITLVVAGWLGALGGGLGGCAAGAGSGASAREAPQPAREVVRGDWDDVEAAIWTAAVQLEIAVERIEWGEDVLRATLRTVRSEPVTVVARRLGAAETGRIEVEAQFGRFPEPDDRAGRLVEAIGRRLGQLEGVGAAPMR